MSYVPGAALGFSDKPFAIGSLIGLRAWGVSVGSDEFRGLRSLFFPQYWTEGVNVSTCQRRETLKDQCDCGDNTGYDFMCKRDVSIGHGPNCYDSNTCDGVNIDCGCGFWAYTNGGNDYYYGNSFSDQPATVSGIVKGYGRCVIGPKGFRAEKCEILALVLPARYRVGIYSTVDTEYQSRVEGAVRKMYPLVPIFMSESAALHEFPPTVPDLEEPVSKPDPS